MAEKPELTEHLKYAGTLAERQTIRAFLDCAESAGIYLADFGAEGQYIKLQRVRRSNDDLISEHLGIDVKKLEAEREQAVEYLKGEK